MKRTLLSAAILAVALAAAGCARNVKLMKAGTTTAGTRWICKPAAPKPTPGTPLPGCVKNPSEVPAEEGPAHTTLVALPAECNGRIHEILVRSAGGRRPEVWVTCAVPEH